MKTLIILHGWQSSKERWQKTKEIVESAGIRVICPDIPGFKPETELKEPWNLDNYISWFSDFVVKQIKIYPDLADGFFLLGHSFGGRMTIKIASKNPFNLRGVILVSAAGIKKPSTLNGYALKSGARAVKVLGIEEVFVIGDLYKIFKKLFYRFILRKTDYISAHGYLKDTIKNILDEDLTSFLDKISVPTKIIWGDKDNLTPVKDAYLMHKKIKNSELEVFLSIKHTPYIECPEKLAESIIKFINKI